MPRTEDSGSIRSYFKRVYEENPSLLKHKTNEEVYALWRADHPDRELTASVQSGVSNIKSELRKSRRRGRRPNSEQETEISRTTIPVVSRRKSHDTSVLDSLEIMIDNALLHAYQYDAEGLSNVIQHLRLARNKVILALGSAD
jgi:hypothetical protein